MSKLAEHSLREVLESFAAPRPTPGGGAASALAGALGASLFVMVAGMPRTRTGDEAGRQALEQVLRELRLSRDHLTELVDRDTEAYDAVVAAHRLPKGTPEEQGERTVAVQAALRGATEVPLDVMRACHAVVHEGTTVARHGNPAAASDIGVALELLGAALRGAAANVRVNLESVRDVGFASGARDEAERLERAIEQVTAEARRALAAPA
jgi:glutamate formiminotransferase/formiminotetrahydrofolate cyclodeaminase